MTNEVTQLIEINNTHSQLRKVDDIKSLKSLKTLCPNNLYGGFIYVLEFKSFLKIGRSRYVYNRIRKHLNTFNGGSKEGVGIYVSQKYSGIEQLETEIHKETSIVTGIRSEIVDIKYKDEIFKIVIKKLIDHSKKPVISLKEDSKFNELLSKLSFSQSNGYPYPWPNMTPEIRDLFGKNGNFHQSEIDGMNKCYRLTFTNSIKKGHSYKEATLNALQAVIKIRYRTNKKEMNRSKKIIRYCLENNSNIDSYEMCGRHYYPVRINYSCLLPN